MEPEDRPADLKRRVEDIITSLLKDIEQSIQEKLPNGVLPAEVTEWWMTHYRSKFYYAIDFKGVKYDDRGKAALKKAALKLGAELVEQAKNKTITKDHAAMASYKTDCPPESREILVEWCN